MASNAVMIKCKTEGGPVTLNELTTDSTVFDLKSCLQKHIHIKPEAIRILLGYPPKALGDDQNGSKLHEVNISTGDTIIIETVKIPHVASNVSSAHFISQFQGNATKETELEPVMCSQGGILMRHVVPSDNSCLFNSIYFILSNGELNPAKSYEMRQVIANAVSVNPVKYNAALLGMENSRYYNWILDRNHWGGAIELSILSEHLKMEIVAVDTITLRMHHFGENDNHSKRILLIYDGIHYDPLILERDDSKQAIFSVYETSILDMALEVAKEARSSRQFTDVATFTVACQECQIRLRGEKEALEHAKNTGHAQFGEL